jgi:hypothetical protein
VKFAENVQANWQEGYCFIMTMPDPTLSEQPRREFRNYSGNFLNIHLTAWTWPLVTSIRLVHKKKHLGGKHFADDKQADMEMQKWLRQQSKDFYAASFNALVKRWDKCIDVGRGHVEK